MKSTTYTLVKSAVIIGASLLLVAAAEFYSSTLEGHVAPPVQEVQDAGARPDIEAFEPLAAPKPVAVFDPADRREEFKARMELLAKTVGVKYNDNVSVEKILFATANSAQADAAIVMLHAEKMKETTALVFIFSDGAWKTFPSDFQ